MKDRHINEENLQQIAEGLPAGDGTKSHLTDCETCREKLDQYKQLYFFLKTSPPVKLRPDFVHRVMTMLPELKVKFSLDYFWIVLSSMFAAGILIYLVGLKPFLKPFTYLQQSLPSLYKPLDTFIDQMPVDWHHFLLGATGLLFVVILDLFIKQVLPHTIKKG